MATPLTADRMLTALRAEGLTVVEHPGWRTHNRNGGGRAWGPVHGVMIHHTAGTPPSDRGIVISGRSDLPGPCAQAYAARDGVVTLTGHGRANHAGGGDGRVLDAVIAEDYGDRPPAPRKHEGSPGAADGNARFYGLECSDPGRGGAWPAEMYDAAVRWAAAICRAHGWTEQSVIGHKEWSDWKPDPQFDMVQFRRDVAARLGTAPSQPEPPRPTPPPPSAPPVVSLRAMVNSAKADPPKQGTPTSNYKDVVVVERALAAEGLLDPALADGHYGTATVAAYAAWQRRLGYSGRDADGIPGQTSLSRLGAKHRFGVTA
ncbi:N-acetylmuramoyl-L-alanine amidase [Yinghuangia sp. YIM S09857]|uniref:N-acetylmuramoyl-L-alanine amidase n=1 Tax=Yinghuangia sp. YIM S09857 TaxID=3436929 RepID=UPI003F536AB8